VLENRVLRKIFGPKKDEVTGEWRRLHKGELDYVCSPHIIRVIKSKVRWEKERCLQSLGSEARGKETTCKTKP